MIFVTVGTHEQQFDRLLAEIDRLRENMVLKDDVMAQTGFSSYEPEHCQWSRLLSCQDMDRYIKEARIVITHGGPASFIAPLREGKIPIVVPRQKRFGEHVNDHQVEFCRIVRERMGKIILVEEIDGLGDVIENYEEMVPALKNGLKSGNQKFNDALEKMVSQMWL